MPCAHNRQEDLDNGNSKYPGCFLSTYPRHIIILIILFKKLEIKKYKYECYGEKRMD